MLSSGTSQRTPRLARFAVTVGLLIVFTPAITIAQTNPVPLVNQPLVPASAAPGGSAMAVVNHGSATVSPLTALSPINLATGLDCSNKLITTGETNDCHWTVTPPGAATAPAKTVYPGEADWWGQGSIPWVWDGPNSTWVAVDANTCCPAAPYSFNLTFDLTGYDLSTVSLSGSWTIDDLGTLSLNGNQIDSLPWGSWTSLHTFAVAAASPFLKQGLNTLTLTITSSDKIQDAVRLEGTLTGWLAIPGPDLTISKTHTGSFTQGQSGATYAIAVSNVGTLASSGTVTVADTLPTGLTATAMSGSDWDCSGNSFPVVGNGSATVSCTTSSVLAAGSTYPTLTLTVNVAANAPSLITNTATVSGGGDVNASNNVATDPTIVALEVVGGTINLATGLDCANNLITTGATNDCHWTVTPPGAATAPAQTVYPGDADWSSPAWISDGPNSAWIAVDASTSSQPAAPYSFNLTFDLSGYNLSTVSLSGLWTIDDAGTLSLNGNQIGSLPNPSWHALHSFAVEAGSPFLKQGLNTLAITITSSDLQVDGVRLEGTLNTTPPAPVAITVQTSPSGLSFTVDGTAYTNSQVFSWTPWSTHTASFSSPQAGGAGTEYEFSAWEDGPTANPRTITVSGAATTYTADFLTQYQITTAVSPAGSGTVTMPISGTYLTAGTATSLMAKGAATYAFDHWSVSPTAKGTLTNATSKDTATVALSGPATVTANFKPDAPPTADAVTPTPASGATQTFSLSYSVQNGQGYSDLDYVRVLFNPSVIGSRGCYVWYYQPTHKLFLANDAATVMQGPLTPGTAGTLSNGQCTVNGAGTTVTGSGATLTLNLSVSASSTFLGSKNIYMFAQDSEGLNSGWQYRGTWTPIGVYTAPTADAVTPTPASGANQTFSLTYSVHNGKGYSDLAYAMVLINPSLVGSQGCYVRYYQPANQLYLDDDAATGALGPLTPGTAGTLSNSQCTVNGAGTTVTGSGATLTLNLSVSAASGFLGTKNIYMQAQDSQWSSSGWQNRGTWTP